MHIINRDFARHFTAVFFVLLLLAGSVAARAEKWKSYKYPDEGFRVSFPAEPKQDSSQKEADKGPIKLVSYCAQVGNEPNEVHLCAAMIDEGAQATGLEPTALLERAKLGIYATPKTHKIGESEIALDGYKGIAVEVESDTIHTFTRIYLVDKTLYQTMVTIPLGSHFPDAGRFFDSFHLIPRTRY